MSTPTWTPTPADELEAPEDLLARFADNDVGRIGADDMQATVQELASALYWQTQDITTLSADVAALQTDVTDLQARVTVLEGP